MGALLRSGADTVEFDDPTNKPGYSEAAAVKEVPGSRRPSRDRYVVHIDPGQPGAISIDMTESYKAIRAARPTIAPPKSKEEIFAAFRTLNLNPNTIANNQGVATVKQAFNQAMQARQENHMNPMQPHAPHQVMTPLGQPYSGPANGNSVSATHPQVGQAHPQFAQQPFQATPGAAPVPSPDKCLFWDIPNFDTVPAYYHDAVLTPQTLTLVWHTGYRGPKSFWPKSQAQMAVNIANTSEIILVQPRGIEIPLGDQLLNVLDVLAILTPEQYRQLQQQEAQLDPANWQPNQSSPPPASPFAAMREETTHAPVRMPNPPPSSESILTGFGNLAALNSGGHRQVVESPSQFGPPISVPPSLEEDGFIPLGEAPAPPSRHYGNEQSSGPGLAPELQSVLSMARQQGPVPLDPPGPRMPQPAPGVADAMDSVFDGALRQLERR